MDALLGDAKPRYGALPAAHGPRATDLQSAGFLSRLLFSYAEPLMEAGSVRQLSNDDLWDLDADNEAVVAYAAFSEGLHRCRGSILRAMFLVYGRRLVACGVGMVFTAACALFAPVVLHHVVDSLASAELDMGNLAAWLAVFFASRLLSALVSTQAQFHTEIVAMRLTVALKARLFDKVLRCASRDKTSASGQTLDIVNLFTTDVVNILWAAFQFNSVWILPLQIIVVVYMLCAVLDVAAFAGLAMIFLSMVGGFVIAVYSGTAYAHIMERKDVRMKAMKEVFGAIQIVKFNAWESKFAAKVARLRASELRAVARYLYLGAAATSLLWASPLFVSMTSFGVYGIVLGKPLTAAKVFTSMALFNAIRDPLQMLPNVVQQCIQAKVSLERIQEFLALDEVEPDNVVRDGAYRPGDVAIEVTGGSFGWVRGNPDPILKEVSLSVHKGDLAVIHGPVGAGKSSLCSALLGDMYKLSGSVFVRGKVAYYSQQTWIQNMTLRDNVLFGNPMDQERYERVLDACGLLPDLDQLPGGDLTEIGAKGVNLSGGQKARVCLARACYSDADVLILDSPLAAVDTVVQSQIFKKCICGLLKDKTVLLVTHIPDIISADVVNCAIQVEEGRVTVTRMENAVRRTERVSAPSSPHDGSNKSPISSIQNEDAKLTEEEDRFEGRVSKSVFVEYFSSMGGIRICLFVVAVQLLWQVLQVGSDLWLSRWTGQKEQTVHDQKTTTYYLSVYTVLGAGSALMVFIRSFVVPRVGLHASRHLFDSMTKSLLSAPLRFFDSNPIGRIMNRFGDDIASVDFGLPVAYSGTLACVFSTVTQLVTAVYMVNILGVLILPLVYLYVKVANFYLVPSRETSRIWKVSSSPVLSYIAEAEEGTSILRAFGSEFVERAVIENFKRVDEVNRVWFVFTVTAQWFQVRMQLLGCGVVIVVVSALIYLRDTLSPGLVGLAFTYALSVDAGLAILVRWWSWVEIAMVSPERILEYVRIGPEGLHGGNQIVAASDEHWPRRGTIEFEKVTFRYVEHGPTILKAISFSIGDKDKVGIVGRTGAGKSSLTMALFRINELNSGRILIDGVDIASLPLRTLRSRLSIIPQSPVLFKGSLRAFMDPFDEFTDEEIWAALGKVDMKQQIARLDSKLSHELSENGENFSVGERQLLCMARALLTQTRIVVMDEATASIDHATEKKLQQMIERDFADATVLTIAHRLATVLASDRILVLSDGEVVEFDTPKKLLANPVGVFHELAKEGGYL